MKSRDHMTMGLSEFHFRPTIYTAFTKLLFVATHSTRHYIILLKGLCHNSNKELNDYASSHGTQQEVSR